MRTAAMVENVLIIRFQLGSLVQSVGGIFGIVLSQRHYAQPHPGRSVLGIGCGFFRYRGAGFIEMVQPELGDAKKQIRAAKMGFERKRFLKAGNRLFVISLFLMDETEIESSFSECWLLLDDRLK